MNKKTFGIILIALVFLFPFRYAVLTPTSSNVVNLVCFLATVLGFIVFMLLTITDGKADHAEAVEKNENQDYKQAA